MVNCESTSGTAPEGGVLSMEELGEIVTRRQKLSVTDEVELSEEMWLEELEETPSDPGELEDLICDPMEVPPTISHHFSILHVLDLSYTEIKSLPQSISRLVALQKLFLRSCEHLMELPPEIGELTNLEVLDLEGTEILCLPKEIAKLVNLTCLKVSFYGYASQTVHKVIPRRVLSNLSRLIELIIDVSPYGEWWDFEVEAIIDDLRSLKQLETLKLYLPTTILLEELKCMFPGLPNFRFTVGRHEEHFISRLPHDVEEEFNNLEKGLKYMNGSHIPNEITKVFKPNAFFLQRHWTAKSLSDFGHENINEVKFCLVMECNEFRTIIDSEQFYQGKDAIVLGSLERLIIRYLKNVESIWKGPVGKGSLSNLKSLVVFTCPNLTTLLTIDMLGNLSNLEEIIVEDCPKIESVVSLKSSGSKSDLFLPSLKKISLIDVPELVSISVGLWIAPKLERLVILYCPKLEKLCTKEVSSTELKVIKGEKEWWDALKWYESDLSTEHGDYLAHLFIPLRRDGDLMAQLTEDEISGYGQGKVGSFNIRDCLSNFSKEELLEEIPSEELKEISSEEVGGFKILGTSTATTSTTINFRTENHTTKHPGTSTATTSTTINFRTELDSYEAACRLDRDLQAFDTTLQARTNQVITSLAAGVEVKALSFDSLKEVTESLLEMNQEVVKVILECKQDIWNTPELFELVEEYFENSLKALDFRTALERCLNRARDSQLCILVALQVFDEESGLEGGKGYVKTLEELKIFKAAGDPFADEFIKIFQDVYSHQTSMLDKLQTKKKKLDKKLKTTRAWRRVSCIIFATTVAAVLICSVVAAAIAAPPVAAALAAASAVPLGSMGTWIDSLWKKYEDAVKGQKDVVRSMEMGTRIAIKDLDNIRVVIDRLEIQIGSLLGNVDFVIEEKAVKIGIEEIKKKVEVFNKNVEYFGVQTDKCIRDVLRARTVVLQRLIKPPNP